jgi:hypothetical protein
MDAGKLQMRTILDFIAETQAKENLNAGYAG